MFGRNKSQRQEQENRQNQLNQAIADAKRERDQAESALKEAGLYKVFSGAAAQVRSNINHNALTGWRLTHISTNALYSYVGRTQITAIMENQDWDREAHQRAEQTLDQAQEKVNTAEATAKAALRKTK